MPDATTTIGNGNPSHDRPSAALMIPARAPAIVFRAFGGPEVLQYEDVPVPSPKPGEVLLRHTAISVNFSDVNARRGSFYAGQPLGDVVIPGNEAVGEIVAFGEGVRGFEAGARVAYAGMGGAFFQDPGAYSTYRAVPASRLIPVPDGIDDIAVAGLLMKGLTASGVLNRFYKPRPGDTVLVHAAASGVGLLLCQWSKHLGARVLGTVGSRRKGDIARRHGCDDPILYRQGGFAGAVRAMCPEGVDAVFDGVGKDTLLPSLDCLRPFGKLVNYGNASGPPPAVDPMLLSSRGSLSLGRLGLSDHIRKPEDYQGAARELFALCLGGAIRPFVGATMPLAGAADAHRILESGQGIGAMVLIP